MEYEREIDLSALAPVTGLPRLLLAALEQTRSSACVTTADLDEPGPTIVYVNPAYCAMTGRVRSDVLGSTPRVMQGPLTDRAVLDRLRADLGDGRRFSGETVNYRSDGSPFIISWSVDPVRDNEGVVTHFVATQEDVTDKVRSANLSAAEKQLDDALTSELTSGDDRDRSLARLLGAIRDGAAMVAVVGAPSVEMHDEQRMTSVRVGPVVSDECDDGADDGRCESFGFGQAGSLTRGTIAVGGLTPDQMAFLDHGGLARFAVRAGSVVAALVEYQRQRDTALRLQHALLPPALPAVPGFDIAAVYAPGTTGLSIGGDWYDVAITDDRLVFTVGDVSGSGIDAAALMGRLRLVAQVDLARGVDVPSVFALLDDVCRIAEVMATMLAIEYDRGTGSIVAWSAGHLPPIVVGANMRAEARNVLPAPPLGHLRGRARGVELAVAADDVVVLFTDGLVERRGEPLTVSLERLVASMHPTESLHDFVEHVVNASSTEQTDDIALLAFRRLG